MFDAEGTGRVSVAELREVLTSLGEKLTEDEVEELFSEGEIGNAALRTSHVQSSSLLDSDGMICYFPICQAVCQ